MNYEELVNSGRARALKMPIATGKHIGTAYTKLGYGQYTFMVYPTKIGDGYGRLMLPDKEFVYFAKTKKTAQEDFDEFIFAPDRIMEWNGMCLVGENPGSCPFVVLRPAFYKPKASKDDQKSTTCFQAYNQLVSFLDEITNQTKEGRYIYAMLNIQFYDDLGEIRRISVTNYIEEKVSNLIMRPFSYDADNKKVIKALLRFIRPSGEIISDDGFDQFRLMTTALIASSQADVAVDFLTMVFSHPDFNGARLAFYDQETLSAIKKNYRAMSKNAELAPDASVASYLTRRENDIEMSVPAATIGLDNLTEDNLYNYLGEPLVNKNKQFAVKIDTIKYDDFDFTRRTVQEIEKFNSLSH